MPNTSATAANRNKRSNIVLTFQEMVELGLVIEEPLPKMIDATPGLYDVIPQVPEVVDLTDDDEDDDDDTSQSIDDLIKESDDENDDDSVGNLLNEIFSRDDMREPSVAVGSAPSRTNEHVPISQLLITKRRPPQDMDERPLKKSKTWNLLGRQVQPLQ